MSTPTNADEEHEFYADPANHTPTGAPGAQTAPAERTGPRPLPEELLEQVRRRAAADDRSVSHWIRRAVEHELGREAS